MYLIYINYLHKMCICYKSYILTSCALIHLGSFFSVAQDKSKEIRIGLHRAQHPQGVDTREMGKDDMDALLKGIL